MNKTKTYTQKRSGKPWSGADITRLTVMVQRHIPVDEIARKLQRSEGAVKAEAVRQRLAIESMSRHGEARSHGRSRAAASHQRSQKPRQRSGRAVQSPTLF
ncbi:MAG TPA: hypothetical protein VGO97_01180 [Solirubrobacterales bacterium]|jgi:hypothetical protein|nr:hypothetical protein [Solirubrobacterales bacterium]